MSWCVCVRLAIVQTGKETDINLRAQRKACEETVPKTKGAPLVLADWRCPTRPPECDFSAFFKIGLALQPGRRPSNQVCEDNLDVVQSPLSTRSIRSRQNPQL